MLCPSDTDDQAAFRISDVPARLGLKARASAQLIRTRACQILKPGRPGWLRLGSVLGQLRPGLIAQK
jgi:hypothetical protein